MGGRETKEDGGRERRRSGWMGGMTRDRIVDAACVR